MAGMEPAERRDRRQLFRFTLLAEQLRCHRRQHRHQAVAGLRRHPQPRDEPGTSSNRAARQSTPLPIQVGQPVLQIVGHTP